MQNIRGSASPEDMRLTLRAQFIGIVLGSISDMVGIGRVYYDYVLKRECDF
jgi:hypothetical protein